MDSILALDDSLTLFFNGSDFEYLDHAIMLATATWTWIPAGLVLLFVCYRNLPLRQFILLFLALALTIACSDLLCDDIVKPYFARPRPSRDPDLSPFIDIVDNYRGGRYGFFSAHASNTMAVAMLYIRVIRDRIVGLLMLLWVLLNCYTRLYLGVHYFGDVTVGLCFGAMWGLLFAWLYFKVSKLQRGHANKARTSTGFRRTDTRMVAWVMAASIVAVFLAPLVYSY